MVQEVMSTPGLIERICYGDVTIFDPANQPEAYYLAACHGKEVLGLLVLHPFNNEICYQAHANYLPKFWGTNLPEYTKLAIQWMFDNTRAKKIITLCPTKYPETALHAERAGMVKEGFLEDSSLYDNKLYGNYIFSAKE